MRFKILFALFVLSTLSAAAQTNLSIRIVPTKADENPYVYVPFDVPARTRSISVSVSYDKSLNRLDFGLFDQRFSGSNSDKRGFRGWSGAIRDRFFLALDEASNGYQAGPIRAGKWRLVVGRARVAPEGVELKIGIVFNSIDRESKRRLEFERSKTFTEDGNRPIFPLTRENGNTWFRGDLHAHTFHGDGSWSVKGALESARANGLDFVALTEHNTFSHHAEIDALRDDFPELLIIRGEEVTTYGGHINVWGLPSGGWVDFRLIPGMPASGFSILNETRRFGGLASVNHPTMVCGGCSWTYDKDWETLDSVEIWNATWDADDEAALKIWDSLLQNGRMITAVGSSDSHQPPYEASPYPTNLRLGDPSVFVAARKLTQAAIFEAIRSGRVFIAENPRHRIMFTAGDRSVGETAPVERTEIEIEIDGFPADARALVVSGGIVIRDQSVSERQKLSFEFKPEMATYARLEIRARDGKMLAMTNPIYFR
ncbi:MAG: PHP domain-containing protein [Acidobacteria bacterium]|nr:PHP domain-containing protein [Acidobacteriota bacterium]